MGLSSAVDSLLHIKEMVFEKEILTLQQTARILRENYEGKEELREELSETRGFGKDRECVIDLVNQIMNCVEESMKNYCNPFGGKVKFGLSSPAYITSGSVSGATFDGRKKGEPYATHISGQCGEAPTLLSMTIESLRKIITEGKVYDREIDWKDMDMTILHQKLALGSSDSVMEMIKSGRKIKVDIWRDFFKQYFTDSDYAKKEIEDFIKNRNHVAHNKLLNWDGYQRMKRNIRELDEVIQKANDSFENSFMSEEEFITWSIGTGNEPKEVYTVGELDYLPIRIYGETGVKIRDNEEIYRLFAESIDKLYDEIADAFYFNTMVEVTGKHEIGLTEDEKKVFSVKDLFTENIILDILADMSFDCAMDGESLLQLFCRCSGGELFHAVLRYHNGSGAEDSGAGKILLSSESVYDTEQLEGFMEEMKRYLEQYLKQQYIEGKSFKE